LAVLEEVTPMTDPLLRALEEEVGHLRHLRAAVLEILSDEGLNREGKLRSIEQVFEAERDAEEEAEELRDRERIS
jgi:hypothetical protein